MSVQYVVQRISATLILTLPLFDPLPLYGASDWAEIDFLAQSFSPLGEFFQLMVMTEWLMVDLNLDLPTSDSAP